MFTRWVKSCLGGWSQTVVNGSYLCRPVTVDYCQDLPGDPFCFIITANSLEEMMDNTPTSLQHTPPPPPVPTGSWLRGSESEAFHNGERCEDEWQGSSAEPSKRGSEYKEGETSSLSRQLPRKAAPAPSSRLPAPASHSPEQPGLVSGLSLGHGHPECPSNLCCLWLCASVASLEIFDKTLGLWVVLNRTKDVTDHRFFFFFFFPWPGYGITEKHWWFLKHFDGYLLYNCHLLHSDKDTFRNDARFLLLKGLLCK